MLPKDRRGILFTDRAVQSMVHGIGLSFPRYHADDMPALDQGGYRQGQRLFRNNCQRRKASIVHLLLAAIGVQNDDLHCLLVVKIGHGRIIESDMIVFSNTHTDDIGWQLFQQGGVSPAFCGKVFSVALQKVDRPERFLVEQVFF